MPTSATSLVVDRHLHKSRTQWGYLGPDLLPDAGQGTVLLGVGAFVEVDHGDATFHLYAWANRRSTRMFVAAIRARRDSGGVLADSLRSGMRWMCREPCGRYSVFGRMVADETSERSQRNLCGGTQGQTG